LYTHVPILMYHQVTPTPIAGFSVYSVTPGAFRSHMRFLAWAGYSTVSLDLLCSDAPLPPRPVVITFDDGFEDCIQHALPHLEAFGFTATFFVVAGLVGGTSRWLRAELGHELPLADWPALRSLVGRGFECGGHSMSHPRLPLLPPDTCAWELSESKRVIEEQLGQEVAHLAYPYGGYSPGIRTLARETGYRTACSTRGGLSGRHDDRYALRRINVTGHDTLLDFACRLRTGRTVGRLLGDTARGAWGTMVGRRTPPHGEPEVSGDAG
jgi:peptidoglycan/xylan/chitin deacetylase (PgdA/CDA1 family)